MSAVPVAARADRRYTIIEYLRLEDETGEKWEFFDGEVWPWEAMAGTTKPHNRIARNALRLIGDHLDGSSCGEYDADMKLMIEASNTIRYPDAAVACDDDAASQKMIRRPRLLIEVTSDSSVTSDHQHKALMYTSQLPTLREYLIIEQHSPAATLHRRLGTTTRWVTTWYEGLEAELTLESIELTLRLVDLYRHVVWEGGRAVERLGHGLPTPDDLA